MNFSREIDLYWDLFGKEEMQEIRTPRMNKIFVVKSR